MTTTPTVLHYLADNIDRLARHPDAEQAWDELEHALAAVEGAVDRRAPAQFVGRCGVCGRDLYINHGDTDAFCRPCNLPHSVEDQHASMLDDLMDRVVRASEAARILPGLAGITVAASDIDRWVKKSRLLPHGHDERGRPLFRVSEILDLARATPRRGPYQKRSS